MTHWSDPITIMKACSGAIDWLRTQPDPETAWQECQRGDRMLWLLGKLAGEPGSDSRRPLVLAACGCARLVLPFVPDDEPRPLRAIEVAEAWARGALSLNDVRAANYTYAAHVAHAVYAAAAATYAVYAAYDTDAAYAASAARYAADAAYAAAHCAACADLPRPDAPYGADYAAYAATLTQCADIVRQHYPTAPILTALDAAKSHD